MFVDSLDSKYKSAFYFLLCLTLRSYQLRLVPTLRIIKMMQGIADR